MGELMQDNTFMPMHKTPAKRMQSPLRCQSKMMQIAFAGIILCRVPFRNRLRGKKGPQQKFASHTYCEAFPDHMCEQ